MLTRFPTRSPRSKTSKRNTTSPCAWRWSATSRFSARPIRARSSSWWRRRIETSTTSSETFATAPSVPRCSLPAELRKALDAPSRQKPRARAPAGVFDQVRRHAPPQRILAATATHRLLERRHGRASLEGIRPLVRRQRLPVRDLGYMASEAQMTLPISDSGLRRHSRCRRKLLRVHPRVRNRQAHADNSHLRGARGGRDATI